MFCWYGWATSISTTGGRWSRPSSVRSSFPSCMLDTSATSTAGCSIKRAHLHMRIPTIFRTFAAAILVAAASLAFAADGYRVVHTYPHDPQAYTQGLIYEDGYLYESTGLNGRSSLRMVDLETGHVLQRADVPEKYFAEGLTDWGS